MSGEPVPSPGSGRSARVTSQWNGKNLLPNPAEAGPGAENLPLISPLAILLRNHMIDDFNSLQSIIDDAINKIIVNDAVLIRKGQEWALSNKLGM